VAPRILGILLLVSAIAYMDRQILAILIEPIKAELGLSDTQAGLLYGFTFAAFYALLGIPIAKIADRASRARIIARSLFVFSTMTVLCGAAMSYWQLLAARMVVGIGEAGTNPASQSMIADLYPMQRRSAAMAIFAAGPHLGMLIGFAIGGVLGQLLGWRQAFVAAGCLSLAVTLLARVSLREPERVAQVPRAAQAVSVKEAVRVLWRHSSTRHVFVGGTLANMATAALTGWLPSFLMRSHGFSTSTTGVLLAFVLGVLGGAGVVLGGWLADRMGKQDASWRMKMPATGVLICAVCWAFVFADLGATVTVAALVLGGALLTFHIGPTFALVQSVAPTHMRALAAALLLFVSSFVGFGLGPLVVGRLSDALSDNHGIDSLRIAMLLVPVLFAWAALHYYAAARALRAENDDPGAEPAAEAIPG